MKIIYYGSISTTDCDFPLLREFQNKGINVISYFLLANWNKRKGLINATTIRKKDEILKASEVEAFKVYSAYFNLEHVYVINSYHHKRYQWQSWILWIKVIIHMYRQHASLIHFVWPPEKQTKLLYLLPLKRVLTVHDPFPHSSEQSRRKERDRRKAFKLFDSFVLLNELMKEKFAVTYHVDYKKIQINRLGEYDCIRAFTPSLNSCQKNSIVFFGQIQSHKGIEYLLDAMVLVHEKHPDAKLVIAGKGDYYFDIDPYKELDYIEFRNRYVPVPELATLLGESLFVVCPYKDATQSGVVQTAFSANVPLIVTDVGNMPDEVKDGELGLVVPPCDANALSKAMNKLLDNPKLLDHFRENIEKIWRPTMSWEPIAKKYIDLYYDLANN